MKLVAGKLGLSADASEEAVLAAVNTVMAQAAEVTPLKNRVQELETENRTLIADQIDSDLAAAGVKDEKVANRLRLVLVPMKNRQERQEFLRDVIPQSMEQGAGSKEQGQAAAGRVLNRGEAKAPATGKTTNTNDATRATAIRNRAQELTKSGLTFDAAFAQATQEAKS